MLTDEEQEIYYLLQTAKERHSELPAVTIGGDPDHDTFVTAIDSAQTSLLARLGRRVFQGKTQVDYLEERLEELNQELQLKEQR